MGKVYSRQVSYENTNKWTFNLKELGKQKAQWNTILTYTRLTDIWKSNVTKCWWDYGA